VSWQRAILIDAYLHAERGFAVGTMSHDDRRNGTVTLFV
jgi:hypothetical protein